MACIAKCIKEKYMCIFFYLKTKQNTPVLVLSLQYLMVSTGETKQRDYGKEMISSSKVMNINNHKYWQKAKI